MAVGADTGIEVAVIGGGITRLAAAHHLALHGVRVACFEAELFGGLVANVGVLDGYPAAAPLAGTELAHALVEPSRALGVVFVARAVTAVELDGDRKRLLTDDGAFEADQLIIASGARLKRLGVPGEQEFAGRGVSQCAFCDAAFFRNRPVAVVGGGDAALQEALHLAGVASEVTLIHRAGRLRARRRYVCAAADNDRFRFRWNTVVEAVLGDGGVEGVRLRSLDDDRTEDLAVDGLFAFIGLSPNTGFLPDPLERGPDGRIVTDTSLETSIDGIFAAGAVRQGYGGQLTQAVADGTTAAQSAYRRLQP